MELVPPIRMSQDEWLELWADALIQQEQYGRMSPITRETVEAIRDGRIVVNDA